LSINQRSKEELLPEMRLLYDAGYKLIATEGTAAYLNAHGIPCEKVYKVSEGRPNIVDVIKNKQVDLIINTPAGKVPKEDAYTIRQAAVRYHVPIITTIAAAKAAVQGMIFTKKAGHFTVRSLQEYHAEVQQCVKKRF
ncbi:MAG TPA: carbamoyl phosphate synthase large subunit, partial [Spirochaetota bacterium]|nr:carbamoyl phosphate synthase large subunit [Spirochaetota bacterium]